ncbi:hypothetical protein OIU79_014542 [Salix purpurea]|uniref:Chalcone/stilbene synthase C-terminal domain-containing protein n=1 Tax=Salix purpurea TaxID=77065 RepID=A0A9Q0SWN4_SALPP|nr:hypothetical protein OIU79_014542 [Salix purpurea]
MAIDTSRACIKKWGRPVALEVSLAFVLPRILLRTILKVESLLATSETTIIGIKPPSADRPGGLEDNIEGFCHKLIGIAGLIDKDYNKMFWAVHPGGPAILNRMMEKRFDLLPDKLNASRIALMDYGNASSNTIVYVLEYMIEESRMM